MLRNYLLLISAAFVLVGCARPPRVLEYSSMSVAFDKTNKTSPYLLRIDGRITNDSDSAAFVDYSADIVILSGKKEMLSLKATKERIFPFSKQVLTASKNLTKEEFAPIAAAFSLDAAAIEKNGASNPVNLDEKSLVLKNVAAVKKDVITLIKEGKK